MTVKMGTKETLCLLVAFCGNITADPYICRFEEIFFFFLFFFGGRDFLFINKETVSNDINNSIPTMKNALGTENRTEPNRIKLMLEVFY